MPISESIEREDVEKLLLDPANPRLGRHFTSTVPSQNDILAWMSESQVLDELAVSFLESGYWTQEALVVVEEKCYGKMAKVVVEGNRRLAALKLLWRAKNGDPLTPKWRDIVSGATARQFNRLREIPYVLADSRAEVQAYLGFRHVSGIKEWDPPEKAEFIAKLVDQEHLDYRQVMRRIGSKTTTVRQNYIAYRLLLQMEEETEIEIKHVEDRFSVLYLSLRTKGVQDYLGIDIQAEPPTVRKGPVPKKLLSNLENYSNWLFGTDTRPPLVRDSRQVDDFGTILESEAALAYLSRSESPVFATAFRMAGGSEAQAAERIERAADEVEEALGTVHHHKKSNRLIDATKRLALDVMQLLDVFPSVKSEVLEG